MTDHSRNNILRLIKNYANRRLYDTHTSSHLTLADVRQLVIEGERITHPHHLVSRHLWRTGGIGGNGA
ncbi:polyhydroxyalkanoate synthesis regulator DNA-binding domain-containing protein [Pseudomonas sp. MMS21-TM103]|nr:MULTISPECIES: polyhydroxyalkanoate synthesis regulator DNA-binding domain-containing protein [unclassified Pseudomonas]MCG4455897.1 polyhydroxyalkanoate synthesis regulator DNA-binding domain-containing protein [Pseudomonas sp. MMS21 TM103]